ncbi:hypothetical protein JCM8097_003302 [Rhodosporidiobolus ruineniae]
MSLQDLNKHLEGKIDFHGQDLVEHRISAVLWATAAVAFIVGLAAQSLKLTFGTFALGYVLCLAWTVPPLPAYTAHPVKWLAPLDEYGEPIQKGAEDVSFGAGGRTKGE